MKMEGSNSELIKISSAKTVDTGGLTFGPAWLRQLSSGDGTKISGLPPSPGLTFQLAKNRYGREEMLAIYETIEKAIFSQPPPDSLFAEFEDLLKKDLQRPVLLSQPSQEEQKYLSTCVNSAAALAAYSKLQGVTIGPGGRGGETGSLRGGAGRGGRGSGSGGQSGRGSYGAERGGGARGRGRGRGGSDGHGHAGKPPALDEDGNPIPVSNSTRGGGRGGYSRGSYNRSSNWEEREPGSKKEYSRAMADENWRSKASISETEENDDKDLTQDEKEMSESENAAVNLDSKNENKSKKEWKNNREWSSYKKSDGKNRTYERVEPHPEWLNDDDDDKEANTDDKQKRMTFDESGKFVPVKEEKIEKELPDTRENKPVETEKKLKKETNDLINDADHLAEKMTQAVINEPQISDINEPQTKLNQANLLSSTNNNIVQNNDPKLGTVPLDHPEAERWFYLDPQNQIQGSFSSEQMAGWLTAGYFSMSLMVKRGCDEKFVPLGVLTQNLGRMPFSSPPKVHASSASTNTQQWSHDQIQMFQQAQFLPQNYHLLQAYIANQQKAGQNTANLNNVIQQIQQIQLQQKAAVASLGTLGVNGVLNNLHELRNKQEALINQCNLSSKTKQGEVFTGLDPAILDAALPNQPVWNEQHSRISPNLNPTPPSSISPINNLMQGNPNTLGLLNHLNGQGNMMLGQMSSNPEANPIKDKIQALFEITKIEEEKRRKIEKEQQIKQRLEEDERRRQQEVIIKQQQEEAVKRAEEERVREEMRKEQQKKKLREIIKTQEEERKRNEETKKKKDEERKKAEELKKQKEEQKKIELIQKQQLEEIEKKRLLEQQAEMARKQAELERQKQKLRQEQLNKLMLPSHAQWAKQQSSQLPNVDLKSVLEQQALEQKIFEQLKQAEALSQQQNNSSSSWSSLFRGQQQSPPSVSSSQAVSLANIQAEQKNVEKVTATAAQKSQAKSSQQNSSKQPWTSWANAANTNSKTQPNDNNGGFWTEVAETKPKQSNPKQQAQVKVTSKEPETKQTKKHHDNASAQQKILHNMTISDEFMKWCHEQLKDFQADCKAKYLHIPTFVNFLREIETCAEIEDYVINYLGESKQAKDFAQQFFINRESQLSQQTNSKKVNDDPSSQFNLREGSFSTKQKQKRRSKGQKLDSQLLGFTVQPDPSLKNRGDIDML